MSIAKPVILGDGALLSPLGTSGFQIGATTALTLQSVVGYSSFAWVLLAKPTGSAATLASATGYTSGITWDKPGRYKIRGTATGTDGAVSAMVVAVVVRTFNRALRKVDDSETVVLAEQVYRDAINELADAADANRIGRTAVSVTSDANRTVTAAEAKARLLDVSSTVTLTAQRNLVVDPTGVGDPMWWVRNNTTGAQALQVIGPTGTGVVVATGTTKAVFFDGANFIG